MKLLDQVIGAVAPEWAVKRAQARLALRHYEAAASSRRTANWSKRNTDANQAARDNALSVLRALARDLNRNNAWGRRGLRVIGNHTVGWGITPKATDGDKKKLDALWKTWAGTTQCDANGRANFYGLQRQVMATVAEAGEALVRRRPRRPADGLAIPMQLQVLEPDYLDTSKDNLPGASTGSRIIQGVEYDAIGRRSAYWLFRDHPGSGYLTNPTSYRVPASEIAHVFYPDRPGQVRGVSWFSPVLVRLKDFDEYEDATLMRQKIAACFTAFVTNPDGDNAALGEGGTDVGSNQPTDVLEPGLILNLPAGREVSFASPPTTVEQGFSANALRYVAAGLGVTYEDLTGDYSQSNFSSARMSRLSHYANVHDWRWNMLIPQLCDPVWLWALEMVDLASLADVGDPAALQPAAWTPPPMPMVDPEKEGLAISRLVRSGAKTHDEMVREQGLDPEEHWQEYADGLKRLDKHGIWLDSDPRRMSQAGLTQERGAGGGKPKDGAGEAPPNGKADATDEETATATA